MITRYGPEKMSELFTVIQRTLSIDLALDEVYGFDQYGLDSEWREALGIEPLPSPEELQQQLQEPESEPSAPEQESAEPTLAATPTPQPVATPTPEPTPVASLGDDVGQPASSGGCSSPSLSLGRCGAHRPGYAAAAGCTVGTAFFSGSSAPGGRLGCLYCPISSTPLHVFLPSP